MSDKEIIKAILNVIDDWYGLPEDEYLEELKRQLAECLSGMQP